MGGEVCVIGAGISGIAAGRALKEAGLSYVCFEAGSKPGGLWWFENDNGMSNIYDSLHTNTSRVRTGFSDLPMPDTYPDFPHHTQVQQYLEAYIRHFGLGEAIQTRHRVEQVSAAEGGGYEVTVLGPDSEVFKRRFRAVLVCNGHHWDPYIPELPGDFDGAVIHSSQYKSPKPFAGKRVLVVGAGNSACDIAVDLCESADVTMSTRSGAHVIPRHLLGRPLDSWTSDAASRLPIFIQRTLFSLLVWIAQGRQSRYGFPTPDSAFLTAHPTISDHLLARVKHGAVGIRRGIARVDGDRIWFVDGESDPYDVIVFATGYSVTFPFFDPEFITAPGNEIALYNHVVDPDHEDLYFIGLIQPLGAMAPLAEAQARWVASLLTGRASLPSRDDMLRTISRDTTTRDKLFVKTRRHTLEVEFFGYLRRLKDARTRTH